MEWKELLNIETFVIEDNNYKCEMFICHDDLYDKIVVTEKKLFLPKITIWKDSAEMEIQDPFSVEDSTRVKEGIDIAVSFIKKVRKHAVFKKLRLI